MRSEESAKLNRSKKVVCFIHCLSLLSEGVLNAIFSVNWDYDIKHVNNISCPFTGYTVVLFIAYLVHHHILLDILFIIIFHIFHLFTWQLLSYQLPHLSPRPFHLTPPHCLAPTSPYPLPPWRWYLGLFAVCFLHLARGKFCSAVSSPLVVVVVAVVLLLVQIVFETFV